MALDDIAPDVDDKELRGDTVVEEKVEQKVEVEQKPEAKVEEKAEVKEETKTKFVPHEALHEERMKRKELQGRVEKQEKEQAEYRTQMEAKLAKLFNPPAEKPALEKDPAGHLKAEVEETKASVKQNSERLENFEKQQEQTRQMQEIAGRTTAAETEFIKKNPDYADAIQHLQKVADANLQAMGVEDPARRAELVRQQSLGLAHQALHGGKDPAAVAYQLAKNYGFQGKKQEAAAEEKKIETIKKGQEQASSLGGGSGGGKSQPITLEQLERMSDDEVDALIADDKEWKKLIRQMS